MKTFDTAINEFLQWSTTTFPTSTATTSLQKLQMELAEVHLAIHYNEKENLPLAFASCMMSLIHCANKLEITPEDLKTAIGKKLALNKTRHKDVEELHSSIKQHH